MLQVVELLKSPRSTYLHLVVLPGPFAFKMLSLPQKNNSSVSQSYQQTLLHTFFPCQTMQPVHDQSELGALLRNGDAKSGGRRAKIVHYVILLCTPCLYFQNLLDRCVFERLNVAILFLKYLLFSVGVTPYPGKGRQGKKQRCSLFLSKSRKQIRRPKMGKMLKFDKSNTTN